MTQDTHGFIDHGAPARITASFSRGAGVDAEGRPVFYQAQGQSPESFFLLAIHLDTGAVRQYPSTQAGSNYPWGMCVASDGRVYVGSCCDGWMHVYDPRTDELKVLGHPAESETYIWGLAEGADGKIYGCTYPNCKLVRYDPGADMLEDLGRCDPTEQYLRNIVADSDGFIYAGIGPARAGLISYDIATGSVTHLIPDSERGPGWGQVFKGSDGFCYCHYTVKEGTDSIERAFRLTNGAAEEIDFQAMPESAPARFVDGSTLVKSTRDTLSVKDPSGATRDIPYAYEAPGTNLFVLAPGPDGKVYISSFLPLYLCSLDPDTGKTEFLGEASTAGGEVYSFTNLDGKLWLFSYPACAVSSYDPKLPYKPSREPGGNPYMLPGLSRFAYRPVRSCPAPDGKKIIVAGVPDYGLLGGSIAVFDPATDSMEAEYQNLIPNQSITGLCVTKDGLICAGSSTEPGSGGHPTEKEAKLFLWDYARREKLFEMVPLPDVPKISDLLSARDGRVYGLSSQGHLIVFDPVSRTLLHSEKLPYGSPAFTALAEAENGKLIALLGGWIVEITPGICSHRALAKWEDGINAGIAIVKGRVYFCSGPRVISYELP